jgi:hypothetical protein
MNRDSGQWRGQAHITGGRLSVRCSLDMATLPAIRFNPAISDFYQLSCTWFRGHQDKVFLEPEGMALTWSSSL